MYGLKRSGLKMHEHLLHTEKAGSKNLQFSRNQ